MHLLCVVLNALLSSIIVCKGGQVIKDDVLVLDRDVCTWYMTVMYSNMCIDNVWTKWYSASDVMMFSTSHVLCLSIKC